MRKKEIKKLDQALSKYVRYSNADKDGLTECFTCGKKSPPKNMHCGQDYGEGSAERVLILSNQTRKFSTQEIIEMRESFTKKYNDLGVHK